MKVRRYHYARKLRQLKLATEAYQQELSFESTQKLQKLQAKIRRLFRQLNPLRQYAPQFGKVLAGAALLLGLSLPAQGQITFGNSQVNPFGLTPSVQGFNFIASGDLDGDGDIDLISMGFVGGGYYGYYGGIEFFYHENIGTSAAPLFAAPEGLGLASGEFTTPFLADLDGDGDLDLIVGSYDYYYGGFAYFENIGTPTNPSFAAPVFNPFGLQTTSEVTIPILADLDGDGDLDLISADYYGVLFYFQNVGSATAPQFAAPVPLPVQAGPFTPDLSFFAFADLDNDGDLDMLLNQFAFGYYGADANIGFVENIGTPATPNFNSSYQVSPFGLNPVGIFDIMAFADLDGDGDMDLLRSTYSYLAGSIFNYNQNTTPAPGSEDNTVTVALNSSYTFSAADFILNPATSGDELKTVRLMSLPAQGSLSYAGAPAVLYQKIDVLNLGQLSFAPAAGQSGANYASFKFKVAGEGSVFNKGTHTLTIDVSPQTSTGEIPAGALNARLMPNPAQGNAWLQLNLAQQPDQLHLRLLDLQGRIVWQYQETQSGAVQLPIDLSRIPASHYILHISHGQQQQTLPLVVK
jgi:hypothetical protein